MKLLFRLFLAFNALLLTGTCWLAPDIDGRQTTDTSFYSAEQYIGCITSAAQYPDVKASIHPKFKIRNKLVFVEESDSEETELDAAAKKLPVASYFTNFYASPSALPSYFIKTFLPSGNHHSYYTSFSYILWCVIRI